jgi:hypothetical protein
MTPTLDGIVLADENDLMIDVPTCHISMYILVGRTGNANVPT